MSSVPYTESAAARGAVIAMSLGIFGIVGAEFLPASLLTPIANDLGVTEGMAGQAVTVTAAVAFVASLTVAAVTGGIDRRLVLIFLSLLLVVSNLLVAVAPDLTTMLLARVLLGVSLGGFWSLSPATIMRLVPRRGRAKGICDPVRRCLCCDGVRGSIRKFFEAAYGWRAVFLAAAGLGMVALITQILTLPPLASKQTTGFRAPFALLGRPQVGTGMLAILLVFTGHFVFFTYLRPFLETVTAVNSTGVALILLVFGVGTFAGNALSGTLIRRSFRVTLIMLPLIMALLAVSFSTLGGSIIGDTVMVAAWGIAFGIVPVSWSTWVTRTMPNDAETGGGLLVATVQLAITVGAAGGGFVFDLYGSQALYLLSAAVLALGLISALRTKVVI